MEQYPFPHHMNHVFQQGGGEREGLDVGTWYYKSVHVVHRRRLKMADGIWRVCINFRAINSISEFDTEVMATSKDCICNIYEVDADGCTWLI